MLPGIAEVAELADALGSGLSGHCAREGSSPSFGTYPHPHTAGFFIAISGFGAIIAPTSFTDRASPNHVVKINP